MHYYNIHIFTVLIIKYYYDRVGILTIPKKYKCSTTVKSGMSRLYWGQSPKECLIVFMWVFISYPSINAVPDVGLISPVNMDMVVDFPAPLWPNKMVIWLGCMSTESLLTTYLPGVKLLLRDCICIPDFSVMFLWLTFFSNQNDGCNIHSDRTR